MAAPQVIAHRGASAHRPENTLAAFRRAAELGARFIETDLRVTRDARFVLLHDARVNRTTNGRGRVANFSLTELRRLDAGAWFAPTYAHERVPTLEEALDLAEWLDFGIYLELKARLKTEQSLALARMLRERRAMARVVVLSFSSRALARMRAIEPSLRTALLVGRRGPAIGPARRVRAAILAPWHERITSRIVRQARKAELGVVAWTVNDPGDIRRMIALGVDGIMSDWPERVAQAAGNQR